MIRHTIGAAALVLSMLAPAQAQKGAVFPPAQYDHSYDGVVYVVVVNDKAFLAEACTGTHNPVGCATINSAIACVMILGADEIIKAGGFTTAVVKRHERGHCNGWPKDHPGARTSKQAGRDADATLGSSIINVSAAEFIPRFRAEREKIRNAKEQAKPSTSQPSLAKSEPDLSKNIWPKSVKTIWPEPDLSKNIWPAK